MHQSLAYYIGYWGNVKWTAAKCDFLGLGGNLCQVLLIKFGILQKLWFSLVFEDSKRVSIYFYGSENVAFGWTMNGRHESCQTYANLSNFYFFVFWTKWFQSEPVCHVRLHKGVGYSLSKHTVSNSQFWLDMGLAVNLSAKIDCRQICQNCQQKTVNDILGNFGHFWRFFV